MFQIDKTEVISVSSPIFPLTPPTPPMSGCPDDMSHHVDMCLMCATSKLFHMGCLITSFYEKNNSEIFDIKYTLEFFVSEFWISLTFPYHPLVDPWGDRQGKNVVTLTARYKLPLSRFSGVF